MTEERDALRAAFKEYAEACYGILENIPATQFNEIRQAFLSGVHWLNTQDDWNPDDMQQALRYLLQDRFPQLPGDGGEAFDE